MLELIIIPLVVSLLSSGFAIVFEHYVVVPHKDGKITTQWKIPLSVKFIVAQVAGIIAFELLLRTIFPNLGGYSDIAVRYLNDPGVTFAGVFYICLASIGLTANSTNKWAIFFGIFIIPIVALNWWSYTYLGHISGWLPKIKSTLIPFVHNILLLWLFVGLSMVLEKAVAVLIIALAIFPINALFLTTQTTIHDAWLGAGLTSLFAALVISMNLRDEEHERQYRQSKGQGLSKKPLVDSDDSLD